MTEQFVGEFSYVSGRDSDGNTFSYTCDQYNNCF